MEEEIRKVCKSLASFCNHIESCSDALVQSVHRRPVPLDSASSTFLQCLNRRVSTATVELNLLDSMSFATVSFEELLGHCYEVFNSNQSRLLHLQSLLKPLGYVPENDVDEKEDNLDLDSESDKSFDIGGVSVDGFLKKTLDENIFDDSLSLKNLGLSDVCLASLASEGNDQIDDLVVSLHVPKKTLNSKDFTLEESKLKMLKDLDEVEDISEPVHVLSSHIKISKDEYESLPSYLKGLATWEDLLNAVDKINSSLKMITGGSNLFRQDEISSLGLGPKARSYLLLLVRLNRLVVEAIDGMISYRVL